MGRSRLFPNSAGSAGADVIGVDGVAHPTSLKESDDLMLPTLVPDRSFKPEQRSSSRWDACTTACVWKLVVRSHHHKACGRRRRSTSTGMAISSRSMSWVHAEPMMAIIVMMSTGVAVIEAE